MFIRGSKIDDQKITERRLEQFWKRGLNENKGDSKWLIKIGKMNWLIIIGERKKET